MKATKELWPGIPIVSAANIARRLGVPLHRVEYVIKSRGIRPQIRSRNFRAFPIEAVELVAKALREIDARAERERGDLS